jgi:acyl-CoA reductase-like NAD-dependent aldehyde dehydrogenase
MYNSGQSCCSVERIYVHSSVYDEFVQEFASVASAYKLGDPMDKETNLGPVISLASAERIRKQVKAAVDAGAKNLIDEGKFAAAKEGSTFVAPVVLVDVNHEMDVMMEEVCGNDTFVLQETLADETTCMYVNRHSDP